MLHSNAGFLKEKVMKKLITIIAFTSIFVMSCKKEFIELIPISSVSTDILYKTDKDFKDALTAVYNVFQTEYQYIYIFGDVRADDCFQEIYKNNSHSYSDTFELNSNDGACARAWQNYYTAIYRINTVLAKLEEVDESVVINKAQYAAEAKFLRALAYFNLVRIFGDVPMVTTPLTIDEGYSTPREPVANIYSQVIIPDFSDAESVLPPNYSGNDVGRPTSGAAKALLGKVYLTISDFQKAETKLQEVTTMGYALLPDFNDLWDYSNEHHSEYIFDIEYEEGMGEGSNVTNRFLPNNAGMAAFFGIGGNGNEECSPTQLFIDLFAEGDERFDVTCGVYGGYYGEDSVFYVIPSNTNQYYTKKYITPVAAANDSKANWKVIRYADVLLMYAEALNENNKTAQAIPYLNQVHERAGLTAYPLDMSQSETRDAIALERRFELAFEGHRWFDLLRTGQAYNVMQDNGMQQYMTVFPIPLTQVDLINDPAILPQNPGYE